MNILFGLLLLTLALTKPVNPLPYCISDCLENTCSKNCPLSFQAACDVCRQISALTFVKIDCITEMMSVYSDSNCETIQTTFIPRTCNLGYSVPASPTCVANCTIALYADVFCNYPLTTFKTTTGCSSFQDTQVVFQSSRYDCLANVVGFYNDPSCVTLSFTKPASSSCDILVTNQGPALVATCAHTPMPSTVHYLEYDLCAPVNTGSLLCGRLAIFVPLFSALFPRIK
jgi:hypothetical protein